jgi:hypothetical protein
LTAGDRGVPFRLGPSLIAGAGLSLALAGAIAAPEGAPIEGVATRVFLSLPDWLIVTAGAAFSIAGLVLMAVVLAAGRRRRQSEDEYELSRQPQKTSPLVVVLLVLLALAPGAIMGGVLVWLALSDVSVVPGPGGITLSDPGAYGPSPDEPPIVPASPLTTGLIGALALLAGLGSLGFALWLGLAGRLLPRPGAAEELGRGLPGPPRHRRPRQCPLEMAIDPQDRGARIGFPPQIVEALLDRLACARR